MREESPLKISGFLLIISENVRSVTAELGEVPLKVIRIETLRRIGRGSVGLEYRIGLYDHKILPKD